MGNYPLFVIAKVQGKIQSNSDDGRFMRSTEPSQTTIIQVQVFSEGQTKRNIVVSFATYSLINVQSERMFSQSPLLSQTRKIVMASL